MTRPRSTIVSLEATPYYHIVTRCVRRAFLCGYVKLSGLDFSHRRDWFMERLNLLTSVFAIDIAAYAVMSNHYHLVIHINQAEAQSWDKDEVIKRWTTIFYGPHSVQKYLRGEKLTPEEDAAVDSTANEWRERLMNLSWFVRCLNEHIAKRANQEDNCTGRFWESRFKSQALLDEKAILSCMAYVDLNPVRAKAATTPETSSYTSIHERIESAKQTSEPQEIHSQPDILLPFVGNERLNMPTGIPFHLIDYFELVDWTGRQIKKNKRGVIDHHLPPILDRIGIEPKYWLKLSLHFEKRFHVFAGARETLNRVKHIFKTIRIPGMGFSKQVFG